VDQTNNIIPHTYIFYFDFFFFLTFYVSFYDMFSLLKYGMLIIEMSSLVIISNTSFIKIKRELNDGEFRK